MLAGIRRMHSQTGLSDNWGRDPAREAESAPAVANAQSCRAAQGRQQRRYVIVLPPTQGELGADTLPKAIALWAVPRSVSTAFEQMMRARRDFIVLNEPFAIYYYYSKDSMTEREYYSSTAMRDRQFGIGTPAPLSGYMDVFESIRKTARSKRTFFKDMAYHLHNCKDLGFLETFTNTFIIRHPRYVLPSLLKLQPDSTFEETGYHDQLKLMTFCEHITGAQPLVIDGQELRRSAPEIVTRFCERTGIEYMPNALNWPATLQTDWDPYWVQDVAASRGFTDRQDYDFQILRSPAAKRLYQPCLELYEEMALRITTKTPPANTQLSG